MSGARFLLDTNILSEPLKPQPNEQVLTSLTEYSQFLAIAAVTYHELQFGCYLLPDSQKKRTIEIYLREEVERKLLILPYETAAAQWHAAERARLTQLGRTPPYADGQIAAIATVNNLTLVTRNESDYQDFQRLKIENWFS